MKTARYIPVPLESDIDFLFEVGTLRHLDRAWKQFGGAGFANVAEHTLRVAFVAMMIAVREGANVERVALMALIHDLAELRTGDANYLQKMYREDDEDLAGRDVGSETALAELIGSLREEFKKQSTLEAMIVKDADNVDCDLELREMEDAGSSISKKLSLTREVVRQKLTTQSAKRLADLAENRSSHEWHLNARNRLTAGDWSDDG